jgi:hypothetical protein
MPGVSKSERGAAYEHSMGRLAERTFKRMLPLYGISGVESFQFTPTVSKEPQNVAGIARHLGIDTQFFKGGSVAMDRVHARGCRLPLLADGSTATLAVCRSIAVYRLKNSK